MHPKGQRYISSIFDGEPGRYGFKAGAEIIPQKLARPGAGGGLQSVGNLWAQNILQNATANIFLHVIDGKFSANQIKLGVEEVFSLIDEEVKVTIGLPDQDKLTEFQSVAIVGTNRAEIAGLACSRYCNGVSFDDVSSFINDPKNVENAPGQTILVDPKSFGGAFNIGFAIMHGFGHNAGYVHLKRFEHSGIMDNGPSLIDNINDDFDGDLKAYIRHYKDNYSTINWIKNRLHAKKSESQF